MSVKTILRLLADLAVTPIWLIYILKAIILGSERACVAVSQRASRWPGVVGEYLRYAVSKKIVRHVGRDVVISFGTVLTKPTVELGDRVYLGSYCLLGDVRVGDDTLIADHVCIPSGGAQHRFDRLDVPIRQQPGQFKTVRIGRDCWIGSGAIILADIGDGCVVGAGSVVTCPVSDYQIVAGNPARSVGDRREKSKETLKV